MTTDITRERIDEGFAEINDWDDTSVGRIKEPARVLLAELLAEDITTDPVSKTDFLNLLTRARKVAAR